MLGLVRPTTFTGNVAISTTPDEVRGKWRQSVHDDEIAAADLLYPGVCDEQARQRIMWLWPIFRLSRNTSLASAVGTISAANGNAAVPSIVVPRGLRLRFNNGIFTV